MLARLHFRQISGVRRLRSAGCVRGQAPPGAGAGDGRLFGAVWTPNDHAVGVATGGCGVGVGVPGGGVVVGEAVGVGVGMGSGGGGAAVG